MEQQPERMEMPQTKRMPIEAEQNYIEWMQSVPKPSPYDVGSGTPPIPSPLEEPREPGTAYEQQ
jgi:hypothetical protein